MACPSQSSYADPLPEGEAPARHCRHRRRARGCRGARRGTGGLVETRRRSRSACSRQARDLVSTGSAVAGDRACVGGLHSASLPERPNYRCKCTPGETDYNQEMISLAVLHQGTVAIIKSKADSNDMGAYKNLLKMVSGRRIDCNLVAEAHLCALCSESDNQEDAYQIYLVGNDDKAEGYGYIMLVLPIPGTMRHQYAEKPPSILSIDYSCCDGIEKGDGQAYGGPVNNAQIACEGLDSPVKRRLLPILHGRALFKFKMSRPLRCWYVFNPPDPSSLDAKLGSLQKVDFAPGRGGELLEGREMAVVLVQWR